MKRTFDKKQQNIQNDLKNFQNINDRVSNASFIGNSSISQPIDNEQNTDIEIKKQNNTIENECSVCDSNQFLTYSENKKYKYKAYDNLYKNETIKDSQIDEKQQQVNESFHEANLFTNSSITRFDLKRSSSCYNLDITRFTSEESVLIINNNQILGTITEEVDQQLKQEQQRTIEYKGLINNLNEASEDGIFRLEAERESIIFK